MNLTIAIIGVYLVALSCVISAAWMAINGIPGWGWFLFLALLCAGSVGYNKIR